MVGTDKEHQVNGNKVLGRKTKWGIIEGESLRGHQTELCNNSRPFSKGLVVHDLVYSTLPSSGQSRMCNFWMSSCVVVFLFLVENIAHCEFAHLRDLLIR